MTRGAVGSWIPDKGYPQAHMPHTVLRGLLEWISVEIGPFISLGLWMGILRARVADPGVVIAFYIRAHCLLRDVGLDGLHTRGRVETPSSRDTNSKLGRWGFMDAEKVGTIS